MLHYVAVSLTYAVVSKVTRDGQGSEIWLTVETFHPAEEKRAYRFQYFGPKKPKKGMAVMFSGTAKVEYYRNKPKLEKYYHDPMDGTPKDEWTFSEVVDADCIVVGWWDVVSAYMNVDADMREVIRGTAVSPKALGECLVRAKKLVHALEVHAVRLEDAKAQGRPGVISV